MGSVEGNENLTVLDDVQYPDIEVSALEMESQIIVNHEPKLDTELNDIREYRDKYDVLRKEKKESETKIEEYQANISTLKNDFDNIVRKICDPIKEGKQC